VCVGGGAGETVAFCVESVDVSPTVVAACVELEGDFLQGHPGADRYLHVTMALAKGIRAVASNMLPARVADPGDRAQRILLDQPLQLSGRITACFSP
jgi:hypothetical protein